MVYHVVWLAHSSLCSKGELSGQFLIVHWQISSGAIVCHSSQCGISIEPRSFYTWDCSFTSLSILGSDCSLLPPEWALCPGHTVVPFPNWLDPGRLWLQPQLFVPVWCLPTPWQWAHYSWLGRRERASTLLCFRLWRCLKVKLYSCKRWIQLVVCPSRFLKLISQVGAEGSVFRWYSYP
jgi:hypothetical protein